MEMAQRKFKIQNLKFKITMRIFCIFFIVVLFLLLPQISFAESDYVLPYPSSMPGSFAYKSHIMYEKISKYWHFGNFGQFEYNLKMADKYLVEAKTLFDYKQYLLGYKALKKSDQYFINILPNLMRAEKNGKNTLQKKVVFKEASQKHIEILNKVEIETPDTFLWQPERSLPTTLNIKEAILSAVFLREKSL